MLKILVAEDDLVSRKILVKLLNKFGDVDIVFNGLEAIDAMMLSVKSKSPYDLYCLDIMMPKVDGIKVLSTIRDYENQMKIEKSKIVMITALNEKNVIDDAFAKGADAYATKPLDLEKFIDVLEKLDVLDPDKIK